MNKSLLAAGLAALVPALLTGCATSNARYIETGGRESVVNVDKINIQDYLQAAETMVNSLLASGALDKVPTPPAILAVSRVVNSTGEQIDTDMLTKKIRIAVSKGGKAVTDMTIGVGADGKPIAEDPVAQQGSAAANFRNDAKQKRLPDFSLSGKIIETRARAGNVRQSTFTFQMALTDVKGGLAVWEDEKEITKQGKRSTVGF